MTSIIAILLGAGASKSLGIPTTDEMAKEFLETTENNELKEIITKITDKPDIETVIQVVRRITELPKNEGLSLLKDEEINKKCQKVLEDFIKTEKELTEFIRKKCLNPDQEKATENYLTLLKLSDISDVKIFTTNYDKAVENVCNVEKIEYTDGFEYSNIDGFPILDPSSFEDGAVQILKLHGSVDWWSDTTRSKIFRLNLELKGVQNVDNLMIYPAQKEDVFNYPFNILQSILIRTLDYVDEFIVIGHKFGDPNIVSAIKVALKQKSNFKLTIVNPSATKIKENIFENNVNVNAVDETIEKWLPNAVETYREIFSKKNEAEISEKRRKDKELKDKIIGEYVSSQRLVPNFSDVTQFIPFERGDPNQKTLDYLSKGISRSRTSKGNLQDRKHTCPRCFTRFNQITLSGSYTCPNCHYAFR